MAMSEETGKTGGSQPSKLFVCCFEFSQDPDLTDDAGGDGTFQIIVQAQDVNDAAAKCRTRLHEIAMTIGNLGSIVVYALAFVEVAPSDIARGLVVNHQELGDVISYDYLPA